jgi:hypothetical protein
VCECIEKAVADSRKGVVVRGDYSRFLTLVAIKFDILRNVTEDLKYSSIFFGWLWKGTKIRLVNTGFTQDGEFLDQLKCYVFITHCAQSS